MRRLAILFLYLLWSVLLSSCAIVSKKDCAQLDWSAKAQQDIQANRNWEKYLEKYNKVCTKHGFSITKAYMSGVYAKGGKICTRYADFPEQGWSGLGVRDALSGSVPRPSEYDQPCAKYSIKVDLKKYNEGVKSIGGRACSRYQDFDDKGWAGVGSRDAVAGEISAVESYVKVCKDHYFTEVNTEDFKSGYKRGLKVFCTKKSGYEFALKDGVYNKTCKSGEGSFLRGYKIGAEVRAADVLEAKYKSALSRIKEITSAIDRNHSEIESLNDDLNRALKRYRSDKDDLDDQIQSKASSLASVSDPDEQDSIRRELADLREDAVDLEEEISKKESSIKRAIEETRFSISRLREERRRLDISVPRLESKYRSARKKADASLRSL